MAGGSNMENTGAVSQLGYIGLGVSDIARWREFACDVLGLQVSDETADGGVFLRMDDRHHRIELFPHESDDLLFKGWEVKDAATLDMVAAKVRAYGIDVAEGSPDDVARRMVLGLVRFNDPAGAPTEIYYGPRIVHTPFISPRGIKSFCAGDLGLGHIGVTVQNPQEYLRFYVDILGAKISDIIQVARQGATDTLTFVHVNPRHHSLAIVDAGTTPPAKHLNHFMIEVPQLDDVGIAHGLFQQQGLFTSGLGRHTNDRMFSFYAATPSGFMIEYGYGARLIEDEENWQVQLHTESSIWGHAMSSEPSTA